VPSSTEDPDRHPADATTETRRHPRSGRLGPSAVPTPHELAHR
jgi:hypothetical protein